MSQVYFHTPTGTTATINFARFYITYRRLTKWESVVYYLRLLVGLSNPNVVRLPTNVVYSHTSSP